MPAKKQVSPNKRRGQPFVTVQVTPESREATRRVAQMLGVNQSTAMQVLAQRLLTMSEADRAAFAARSLARRAAAEAAADAAAADELLAEDAPSSDTDNA
jgi:hypothetical protein